MTNKISDMWQTPDWLYDELNNEFNFDVDLCATKENTKCYNYMEDYLNHRMNSLGGHGAEDWHEYLGRGMINAAFCNPPYSDPKPFVEQCWSDSLHCKIVMLVKCDPSTRWWGIFWNYKDVIEYCCPFCVGAEVTRINCGRYHCPRCNYANFLRPQKVKAIHKAGPKPGCEVRFPPKRVKFDPPQSMVDSGEVWKVGKKWVRKCSKVVCVVNCSECRGKGYKELSGPTFPSALIIMDRYMRGEK